MNRLSLMRAGRCNPARALLVACLLAAALAVPRDGAARREAGRENLPAPARTAQDAPLVVNTDLVSVSVTVTDREGRHVGGLDRSAFTVIDDEVPQEISHFGDGDEPASLAVIFDTSGSMGGDKLARAREALARFVETSHGGDEYFLISFSDGPRLLLDGTHDADALLGKFAYARPGGATSLYDAVYVGVERVTRGSRARRAVLLITDGVDTCSRYTFKELRRSLQESDVVLYAVGVLDGPRVKARRGRFTLEELASVTGGKAFFPGGAEETYEAFERIALELRHQYSLGYRPTDLVGRGEWHSVRIKAAAPGESRRLRVRSRDGYYAVMNPR